MTLKQKLDNIAESLVRPGSTSYQWEEAIVYLLRRMEARAMNMSLDNQYLFERFLDDLKYKIEERVDDGGWETW